MALGSGDFGNEANIEVASCQDVIGLERNPFSFVADERAGDEDVRVSTGRQPIRAILLELLAQGGNHRLDQPRFRRLIFERIDLDGLFSGGLAGGGAQSIAGAPHQAQAEYASGEESQEPHRISFARSVWPFAD